MTIYVQSPKRELTSEEWIEQYRLSKENSLEDIENLTLDDCKLVNYNSHKAIKAEMAV